MFKKFKEKFKKLPKWARALIRLVTKLAIMAGVVLILFNYIIGLGVIHTPMNFPSLKDGDLIITYRLSECHTGDMVKYTYDGVTYYGRIIAFGGDIVEISEERYLVNGIPPYETIRNLTLPVEDADIEYPYTVDEGQVFIMVDHREDGAVDSRNFGGVPLENIEGKIIFVFRSRGI